MKDQLKYPLEFQQNSPLNASSLINWNISNSLTQYLEYLSNCGDFNMVGGFKIFGSKAYMMKLFNNLLPHYSAGILLYFYKIDSWDSENMMVYMDAKLIINKTYTNKEIVNVCGNAEYETIDPYFSISQHSSSSLSLEFISNLDSESKDESWGINNFQFSLFLCDPTCLNCTNYNKNNCSSCYSLAILNSNNECLCIEGYYIMIYSNPCKNFPCSKCMPCLNECQTCSNRFSCLTCLEGYYFFEFNSTCLLHCPTNMILYDNSCLFQCPDNLYRSGYTCIGRCPIYLLFENKTCVEICPTDYVIYMFICYSMCPESTIEFDKSCILQCSENFIEINKTCKCQSDFFLTPDYRCLSQCPSKYYTNPVIKKCNPCNEKCQSCSGPDDNQCLSCISTNYFIKGYCVNSCPDFFFANDQKMECQACKSNCQICQNESICVTCKTNYRLIDNFCKYIKEIKGKVLKENNPFQFKIMISEEWEHFFSNYQRFFKSIFIENFAKNYYNFVSIYNKNDPHYIILIFNYTQTFKKGEKNLKIWLSGEDPTSDNSTYYLIDQNLSIALGSLAMICKLYQYYSQSYFF